MTLLIRFAMVALPTSLIFAACGGSSTDPTASLAGQWEIEQIANGSGVLTAPVAETSPFVAFSDVEMPGSAATGNSGCNTFSGGVEIGEDGGFEAGDLVMTLMGCPGDLGEQDRLIIGNMTAATTWSAESDTATLSAKGSVLLALRRIDTSLEGSAWAVIGINNQTGGSQSVVIGTEPTLWFRADGRFTGTAGCNDMNGSYGVDEETIEIGQLVTTRMFCQSPEGVMDQERNMAVALNNAATYEVDGFSLNLRDADGHTVLNAQRIPEPRP